MFDFDASKFVLIGIVALIFIGPKELPGVLRQVGQFIGKMRRMASEFQGQFMDAMKEADVANLKEDLAKLKDSASLNVDFNPVADIKNSIEQAVTPAPVIPVVSVDLPPVPEVPAPVLTPPPVAVVKAKPRARLKMTEMAGAAPAKKAPVRRARAAAPASDEKQA